jgi:hypothetical protein
MEPPAALASSFSIFGVAIPGMDCEPSAMMTVHNRLDDAGFAQIELHDQIHMAPRVCRFFNAYLDADAFRRADFREAVAFASHRFGFDPPATPSLEEDIAAALAIAQEAADIAYATGIGEVIDAAGSGSADSDLLLLADSFAALALGYRYVVGVYATDPTLGDLGEVAVRFVLLAEREHDSALAATTVASPARPATTRNAFRPNQELESSLSIFLPPAAGQKEGARSSLKSFLNQTDQILHTA